ncbi:cytochrome b N-terminal domain-containing protein [Actinomadura barringtoniae]|uniref:Cytochrome bc1 complex cytochrome b subunit n=1 Tax=Actinomadura barringtoniae TaxID=1427535 RepID=A0A939TAZ8_9ACTN|nr:cytochrome b N-terminal domain-containing protein [Actinomadura barringtoniae]MBO2453022.1 cytochrome b N-terminal domain-containing protein [Actinomadura barringtoniae]
MKNTVTARALPSGDRWIRLFGQIAISTFALLVATGAFLTVYVKPDMTMVKYDGSYMPLKGIPVSKAYDATVDLSLEVRGGLLIRQVHHWSALIFIAAVCLLLMRLFFTGAFRRPHVPRWLIWITLLVLGMAAGLTGTILPDDMLSGGSLGLIQGVTESIPFIGTRLSDLLFGGDFPGDRIIPMFYWLHVLAIPLAMAGLLLLLRRVAVRTRRLPGDLGQAVALFFATTGVVFMLGTFAQVNPVWQYGPYRPGAITSGAVPGWYMGFMDGAIRIMPNWEPYVAGHPLTLAVLVPALIVPGAFFTVLAAFPWIERRLTGDGGLHHYLDRPRDAATRTAVGAAGVTFYGLLWAAAANDQIAFHFHVSLYAVTWFFRIAIFAGPLLAYTLAQRLCLGLTWRERHEAEHGRETGRIVMSVNGAFSEITEPVDDREPQRQELASASSRA